jgi:hypothetical protein
MYVCNESQLNDRKGRELGIFSHSFKNSSALQSLSPSAYMTAVLPDAQMTDNAIVLKIYGLHLDVADGDGLDYMSRSQSSDHQSYC